MLDPKKNAPSLSGNSAEGNDRNTNQGETIVNDSISVTPSPDSAKVECQVQHCEGLASEHQGTDNGELVAGSSKEHRIEACPVFEWCGEHDLVLNERAEDQWHFSKSRTIASGVRACRSQSTHGSPELLVDVDGVLYLDANAARDLTEAITKAATDFLHEDRASSEQLATAVNPNV